jgi:hypothetical protein
LIGQTRQKPDQSPPYRQQREQDVLKESNVQSKALFFNSPRPILSASTYILFALAGCTTTFDPPAPTAEERATTQALSHAFLA